MKATEIAQPCPYTGLRSFTEEESLYFKGRDGQVDQVTKQLEERKFLMLTGASGEGKSSLIYAGLIPNARAGFFKARYASWTVVDFRPERSPIKSMARALSEKFALSETTIETEMRRGYSSLIDLYLNSDFFVEDKNSSTQVPNDVKKARTKGGSNLLLIIDQFEEFFTNPENYYDQNPSQDSQVVVNLILETAKIALQQNLPIYVVCTMRSDYIGQCASFRGLPEYIGYSQFFVPRLKRKELKQVIEEPAELSGNRITQRLTERLVYDLAEGVDQLPILQHALSQIWLMADHGNEEMDLIHYAMVGGMPASELPVGDLSRFNTWFKNLPEYEQKFYQDAGLNKVIENHASRLYESAAEYYNTNNPATPIAAKDAKNIVALTFSCLTKIDNSRAVRNRMTLREITSIINRPELSAEVVGKVLNIFREDSNSFIRPFKTEDASTHNLSPDAVLDITHESLIRNWGMLHKWASREYEYYSTFLDLKKQLDRWKEHGRSKGYLLPIGPLSYFENWYSKCNPNTAWINRYAERKSDSASSWKQAEELLLDIKQFLKRSARHVMVSRAFIKYGAQKIAAITAMIALLVFSGFYWYDSEQKKNERIIRNIQGDARMLLKSVEVSNDAKAIYLLTEDRYKAGGMISYLSSLDDPTSRISLSIDVYKQLIFLDKKYRDSIKFQLINSIKKDFLSDVSIPNSLEFKLSQLNKFILLLAYDNYYNPNSDLEKVLKDEAEALYDLMLRFFQNKKLYKISVSINLNQAIQNWLTFASPSPQKINALLDLMSPLSNEEAKATFNVFYPKGSFEPNGVRPADYNAGHHTLASLYAATGDLDKLSWCFEQLRDQPDYFTDKVFNNYSNVIGYLYQFGHRTLVPPIVARVSAMYASNTPDVIYRDLVIRSGYMTHKFRVNFQISYAQFENGNFHLNLCLASREHFNEMLEDYEKSLASIRDVSERNFLLAMHYKRSAMFQHKYNFDRDLPVSTGKLDALLDKAWNHFLLLSEKDQEERVTINYAYFVSVAVKQFARRQLFTYPDCIGGWLSHKYHSDLFFDYLDRKNLLDKAYSTPEDLEVLHYWIANSFELKNFAQANLFDHDYPVSDSTLIRVLDFVGKKTVSKDFDTNLLVVVLTNRAFHRGDTLAGMRFFKQFRQQDISKSTNRYDTWNKNFFGNQLMELSANLSQIGRTKESIQLIGKMDNIPSRIISYNYVAGKVYDHSKDPSAFVLLDSALSQAKVDDPSALPFFLEYRNRLVYVLNKIGGKEMVALGNGIFRDTPEQRKFQATRSMVKGIAERGDYHDAVTALPSTLTEEQELVCRTVILLNETRQREVRENRPGWTAMDTFHESNDYVLFFGFL